MDKEAAAGKGGTAGVTSDGELGPRAASKKAGYAGAGLRSGSFHGLSRRSGPGAWLLKPSFAGCLLAHKLLTILQSSAVVAEIVKI